MDLFENWQEVQKLYEEQMVLLDERSQQDEERISILEKQKAKLEGKKERLVQAVADGTIEMQDVKKQMDALKEDIAKIDNTIFQLTDKKENIKQEWDYILAKFSHERREELMVKYCLEENEEDVNQFYREVIEKAELSDHILELEYITGTKVHIDVVDLSDSLRFRIEGLKELIGNTQKNNILASKN
jgi:chromosome segregation ATPase